MTPELWLVPLWAPAACQARLEAMLEPHEREQAERFAFPWLRTRYAVAHAALRTIAARCLGATPASLRWAARPNGKPWLPGAGLELNLSHTGDWGMIAVGHRYPVGVDIEAITPDRANPDMIRAVTSTAERAAFAALPPREHAVAFFRLWVRKEAVIKALGTGLSRRLDTIDVPLAADAPRDGVVLRPSEADARARGDRNGEPAPDLRWWLWDVPAPLGHLAALVVGQPDDEPPQPPGPLGWLGLDDLDPEPEPCSSVPTSPRRPPRRPPPPSAARRLRSPRPAPRSECPHRCTSTPPPGATWRRAADPR